MRPMRRLPLLMLAASCAGGVRPRPEDTTDAYRRALLADDPAAAHALLSSRARGAVPAGEFARAWKETAAERADQERALAGPASVELWASTPPGGETTELVRAGDFWRIRAAGVPGQPARTPEEAVRALVRAVERNDLRSFLRLLSAPAAQRLQGEIRRRVDRLKAALDKPIPVEGDRATFQYDPSFRLELRREGDEWRVADFD